MHAFKSGVLTRCFASGLTGAAFGLSFSLSHPLALLLSFFFAVPLLWALEDRSALRRAFYGMLAGGVSAFWMGQGVWFAFKNYFELGVFYAALLYALAIVILCALPWVLFSLLFPRRGSPFRRAVFGAMIWAGVEYIYSRFYFPSRLTLWGTLFYSFDCFHPWARFLGGHFLSFLVMGFNFSIFEFFRALFWNRVKVFAAAIPLIFFMATVSLGIFFKGLEKPREGSSMKVALIQTNLPHSRIWNSDHYRRHILTYLEMTGEAVRRGAQLILWAETALIQEGGRTLEKLMKGLDPDVRNKSPFLVTGARRMLSDGSQMLQYNSCLLADLRGKVKAICDKEKYLLFTERIPFGLDVLKVEGIWPSHYMTLKGPARLFELRGARISALICNEALHTEVLLRRVRQGAQAFVQVSNDNFYGPSRMREFLFRVSRMRAVEFGVPILRVSVTGITGILFPDGTVHRLEPDQKGILLEHWTPGGIPSLYAKIGDVFPKGAAVFFVLLVFQRVWRRSYNKRKSYNKRNNKESAGIH